MIQLVPMTDEEFQQYRKVAVEEYAQEHTWSGRWTADEAYAKADQEYRELLPDGVSTLDNYLYSIKEAASGTTVGLIWFAALQQGNQRTAFIFDVQIYEQFRRRGYATQALKLVETESRSLGLTSIALHVFGKNHAGLALYEKLGYAPTDIKMVKTL